MTYLEVQQSGGDYSLAEFFNLFFSQNEEKAFHATATELWKSAFNYNHHFYDKLSHRHKFLNSPLFRITHYDFSSMNTL